MPFGAADIVLFGIQAGVRLFGQARQAYVERTRERDLTLPLPGLDHESTASRARAYFEQTADGRRHVVESPRLRALHQRAMAGITVFRSEDPDAVKDYIELYDFHRLSDRGVSSNDGLHVTDIVALNTVAQWRRGDTPHPTALQRIAGSVIEIGVDYFTHGPGAGTFAGNSPSKKLVREVLDSLDDQSFTTEGLEGVVEAVFVATLDTIAESPSVLSSNANVQKFVSGVAKGVVEDVKNRIELLPEGERLFAADRFGEVAEGVFRSMVRHGAEAVLNDPQSFLGTEAGGESAMAQRLGAILLDTVLPEEGTGFEFDALVRSDTIDHLAKGALDVVAQHPDLLGVDDAAIRRILQGVASGLAAETRKIGPGLLGEAARLVLQHTADNLDTLWKPEGDGENLAVTAVASLLGELSRAPDNGAWTPKLSRSQLLDVTEQLLDSLAANPALVTRQVGGRPAVRAAVRSVLDALAAQELDNFSSATAASILAGGIEAAATRWEFLETLQGDPESNRSALRAVLDAVLTSVGGGDEKAAWALARGEVLAGLTTIALEKLTEHGVTEGRVENVEEALTELRDDIERGGTFSLEVFADSLVQKFVA